MRIGAEHYRTIWHDETGTIRIIDQTKLPFAFEVVTLVTLAGAAHAIAEMQVRGAPLIGAAAAYGMVLGMREDASDGGIAAAREALLATRPTAQNLAWAVDDMAARLAPLEPCARADAALARAGQVADEDVARNRALGRHGAPLLEKIAARKGRVNVLTHCNAGWLAAVDWGTATAPIYEAHDRGVDLHVWVDETRPRNQGGHLTAWELAEHGVPHTVIVDNAGGHLMQAGAVDICLVGTDRTAPNGDVANKIGTYLKALAAADAGVPFYVCLPSPTIDWSIASGQDVPIEARDPGEVTDVWGLAADGVCRVRVVNPGSAVANPAFDVTPARLITSLITEAGIAPASREGLARLFPGKAA